MNAIETAPLFVDGAFVRPSSTQTIDVINPTTESLIGRTGAAGPSDVNNAVGAARTSFENGPWRWMSPSERSDVLDRAAALLDAQAEGLVDLIIDQNGSPKRFVTQVQVPGSMDLIRMYARVAREYPFEERVETGSATTVILREPVGVVAAIVPWNSPMRSAMLKAGPALAAGCSVVHKPSPETPFDALRVAQALSDAGLPKGVFNVVTGGADTGRLIVEHPDVDRVAFTGSTAVGRWIMATCAERIARISLELGGKSAAIVLDDADAETTARGLLPHAFMNSGQACVAQTRILVPAGRQDEFVDALREAVRSMSVGDPRIEATVIGPMVTARHRKRVEDYISLGRDEGARVVVGGGRPRDLSTGWFVEPTLFSGVDNGMRIAREEIFGPVVCVIAYDGSDAEAVRTANDSQYGLDGTVWTSDADRGLAIARRVRTGRFEVNGAAQAPDVPYGGFKQSGVGREAAPATMNEYVETKTIGLPLGR